MFPLKLLFGVFHSLLFLRRVSSGFAFGPQFRYNTTIISVFAEQYYSYAEQLIEQLLHTY